MADFAQSIEIAVPAGSGTQTVGTTNVPLGLCEVQRILVTFPPGCMGNVGVAIAFAGSPVYPNQSGQFFIFDDYILDIPVSRQKNSGAWQVLSYNVDSLVHTVQVIFEANYLIFAPDLAPQPALSL